MKISNDKEMWDIINDKEIKGLVVDYLCKCLQMKLAVFHCLEEDSQIQYGAEFTKSLSKLSNALKYRKITEDKIGHTIATASSYYFDFYMLSAQTGLAKPS